MLGLMCKPVVGPVFRPMSRPHVAVVMQPPVEPAPESWVCLFISLPTTSSRLSCPTPTTNRASWPRQARSTTHGPESRKPRGLVWLEQKAGTVQSKASQ